MSLFSKSTKDDSRFFKFFTQGRVVFCSGLPSRLAKRGCRHRGLQYRNVFLTTVSFYLFLVTTD